MSQQGVDKDGKQKTGEHRKEDERYGRSGWCKQLLGLRSVETHIGRSPSDWIQRIERVCVFRPRFYCFYAREFVATTDH